MSKSQLDIRLRLDGEVKRRFLAIKAEKGLTNNTEVLRLIIKEYYDQNGGIAVGPNPAADRERT